MNIPECLVVPKAAFSMLLIEKTANLVNECISDNVGSQARVDFGGANQPKGSEERSRIVAARLADEN